MAGVRGGDHRADPATGADRRRRSLIDAVVRSQADLEHWLARLGDRPPGEPSQLPGWTLGHVLTHLARDADSHLRLLAGAPQYPGGSDQRTAEIEAGADRPWDALLADLRAAQARLAQAWANATDGDPGPAARVERSARARWREVEVHRVDLGLGYRFADVPADFLRHELAGLTMRYRASRPIGLTQLPAAAATAPPHVRVAWLLGRAELDGVGPAGVYDD